MLKKGCIGDLKSGALTKTDGYLVVAMCHYPRGVKKTLIDAYAKSLAPDKKMLDDFHAERERLGGNHNAAFLSCGYQKRFTLPPEGLVELKQLADLSRERDVVLVCQCELDQRCHRELLLIMAKKWWHANTELRTFSYPEFEKRLGEEGEIASA
ncbi:MAG TPA: DUF488 family protein [Planctomycetota bacterium]|nr:DUF488 family protein [Planctomycetota bacterium]